MSEELSGQAPCRLKWKWVVVVVTNRPSYSIKVYSVGHSSLLNQDSSRRHSEKQHPGFNTIKIVLHVIYFKLAIKYLRPSLIWLEVQSSSSSSRRRRCWRSSRRVRLAVVVVAVLVVVAEVVVVVVVAGVVVVND